MTTFLDDVPSIVSLNHINLTYLLQAELSATFPYRMSLFKDNSSLGIKGVYVSFCWVSSIKQSVCLIRKHHIGS